MYRICKQGSENVIKKSEKNSLREIIGVFDFNYNVENSTTHHLLILFGYFGKT
jgi:hypothetical protein